MSGSSVDEVYVPSELLYEETKPAKIEHKLDIA